MIQKLKTIAAAHNCSLTEVALSWLVNFHGDIVVAIPGATRLEQVHQNFGALTLQLSQQEMSELDYESKLYK